MIFSNIGRYSGPFSSFFYASEALWRLYMFLHGWHLSRGVLYPPFEEDARP